MKILILSFKDRDNDILVNSREVIQITEMIMYFLQFRCEKPVLWSDLSDNRATRVGARIFGQVDTLTGSAVITHNVTTGTGYCLVGFNWIIDFFNWPIRHSVK